MQITLNVAKVQILLTHGADEIHLSLNGPTPFPSMGYNGTAKICVQAGYGEQWCREVLGVNDIEVINTR